MNLMSDLIENSLDNVGSNQYLNDRSHVIFFENDIFFNKFLFIDNFFLYVRNINRFNMHYLFLTASVCRASLT